MGSPDLELLEELARTREDAANWKARAIEWRRHAIREIERRSRRMQTLIHLADRLREEVKARDTVIRVTNEARHLGAKGDPHGL